MSAPQIHAPDGGIFGHALCEEPTGDTTIWEHDVTCSDCLDLLEVSEQSWAQLTAELDRLRRTKVVR